MAVEAAVGVVVEHLFNEVVSLAAEEVNLVLHFKDDLKSLAGELEIIQALVVDADGKDIQLGTMQLWLRKLKDVASDAEDVLEDYKYELFRRKIEIPHKKWEKVRSFFSPIRKLAFRLKMAHKIKDVYSQLKSVKERGMGYGLNPSEFLNRSSEVKIDRMTSPSVQESTIVGRDEDVIKVVDMLVNANIEKHFAVTGIIGMGGQGKTALAQHVYKHDKVVNHFEHRIWICVSEDFKVERILNEMVQCVTEENSNLTNRQALIEKLQNTLKGKKYLLTLDDVWNDDQEKWDRVKNDLREIGGSRGTKIMVTTRSEKVVSTMLATQIHRLGQLSENDSLTLFQQRAFAEGRVVETSEFLEIGQRMVKRCGGVPLAIKALGGLLYSKKDVHEWLSIEKSDIWSSTNSQEGVLPSIKLSYNHLPSLSLRQCFAYCSIFPKDTVMKRKKLIQLWMAQGFLNPPKGSHLQMEDLGNDYFNVLLWNSLLQEPKYDDYNKIWSCKMHDIVHDFALLMSKDYCFTRNVGQDDKDTKGVHLSLISSKKEMVDMSQEISPKLRTLYLPSGVIGNELIKFRHLRTLVLEDREIEQLPTSIGRLKQLRCIDIKKTGIKKLPASYIKLYNLQTLRVNLDDNSEIFLGSLINLRHIDLDSSWGNILLMGVSHLSHLQTLSYFNVSDKMGCKIEELGPLNNLRGSLIIDGLEKVKNGEEAQKANISQKSKVNHLQLRWTRRREALNLKDEEDVIESLKPHPYLKRLEINNFRGSRFPSWMTNELLKNLVEFKLAGCDSCEQFPPLGHLPSLRSLSIKGCKKLAALPPRWLELCASLEEIEISFCPAFQAVDGYDSCEQFPPLGHLPSLRSLNISMCEKLAALPPRWLELCTSLEEINISYCPTLQGVDGYGLERLPNLKTLNIGVFSKELDYFPWPHNTEENGELYFASLKKLWLCGWSKLTSLPEQIQHLPSLRFLVILGFEELKVVPEWLGNIPSLQSISLFVCENVEYMPSAEAMQRLTNLQELNISKCPKLKERCTIGSGPEWHKIAHIPNIYVD